MRKVWKIGSRWDDIGAPGTSILDTVFIPNRVVCATTTLCLEIKEGDLFAVADGNKIVAIAEALTPAFRMDRLCSALHPNPQSFEEYLFADNYGCKVRFFMLDKKDVFEYAKRGKLFVAGEDVWRKVNALFDALATSGHTSSDGKGAHNVL